MAEKDRAMKRLSCWFRGKSFVFKDFLLLAAALLVFFVGWFAITRGSNLFFSGSFYSKGYEADYMLEGTIAERLGADTLSIRTVEEGRETATVLVKVGGKARRLVVDRNTAKVLQDTQTGVPLVYYYDIVREPGDTSRTFDDDNMPYVSTEFTGLKGRVRARIKRNNPDNVVMWYHRSPDKSYGPQYSWELQLYDEKGTRIGTIVNDLTSGVLLEARFCQDGWGSATLTRTNYPTGMNRWVLFYGFNAILLLWGIFHVLRARKHREEWEAGWTCFPLNFVGISRFFIRLLAFTVFDFLGMGILTGNLKLLLVSDIIGLVLMCYAVGAFAFPVLFKFIPWIAAFGVFAAGRSLDYVQYPFGVPLYLIAVVSYLLYRYLSYRRQQWRGLEDFLDRLPEVAREAVLKELESSSGSEDEQ